MAEEVQEIQQENVEESKPKKSKLPLVFGGIIIIFMAVQTVLIVSLFIKTNEMSQQPNQITSEVEKEEAKEEEIQTAKYLLDPFMVNLKTTSSADNYLRATAYLEYEVVEGETLDVDLEEAKIEIQDEIIKYIRTKTLADVRSADSVEVLSSEIVKIANEILGVESIKNVHFSQFLYN